MPIDKNFKRLVRERMAKTGESYVVARHHLLKPTNDDGEPTLTAMWTWPSATAFKLAQDEARLHHAAFLEPEHLLLGLLDAGGPAVALLLQLGVSTAAVRAEVDRQLARVDGGAARPAFSEATKQVLRVAADEALENGTEDVDELALLMAIASSPTPAAAALAAFGAGEDRLRSLN